MVVMRGNLYSPILFGALTSILLATASPLFAANPECREPQSVDRFATLENISIRPYNDIVSLIAQQSGDVENSLFPTAISAEQKTAFFQNSRIFTHDNLTDEVREVLKANPGVSGAGYIKYMNNDLSLLPVYTDMPFINNTNPTLYPSVLRAFTADMKRANAQGKHIARLIQPSPETQQMYLAPSGESVLDYTVKLTDKGESIIYASVPLAGAHTFSGFTYVVDKQGNELARFSIPNRHTRVNDFIQTRNGFIGVGTASFGPSSNRPVVIILDNSGQIAQFIELPNVINFPDSSSTVVYRQFTPYTVFLSPCGDLKLGGSISRADTSSSTLELRYLPLVLSINSSGEIAGKKIIELPGQAVSGETCNSFNQWEPVNSKQWSIVRCATVDQNHSIQGEDWLINYRNSKVTQRVIDFIPATPGGHSHNAQVRATSGMGEENVMSFFLIGRYYDSLTDDAINLQIKAE